MPATLTSFSDLLKQRYTLSVEQLLYEDPEVPMQYGDTMTDTAMHAYMKAKRAELEGLQQGLLDYVDDPVAAAVKEMAEQVYRHNRAINQNALCAPIVAHDDSAFQHTLTANGKYSCSDLYTASQQQQAQINATCQNVAVHRGSSAGITLSGNCSYVQSVDRAKGTITLNSGSDITINPSDMTYLSPGTPVTMVAPTPDVCALDDPNCPSCDACYARLHAGRCVNRDCANYGGAC